MSLRRPILGIKVKEDDNNLFFSYDLMGDEWVLIYNKDKDSCLLLKNSKPAPSKKLTLKETDTYLEVLDFAISYHHEKGDAESH